MIMHDLTCRETLYELETQAYMSGDKARADLLSQLAEQADDIETEPERIEAAEKEAFERGKKEGADEARSAIRDALDSPTDRLFSIAHSPGRVNKKELAELCATIGAAIQ